MSAAVQATVDASALAATFGLPEGFEVPIGATVSLTGSHIRPQPGFGYDERRHVTVWGTTSAATGGQLQLRAERAWGWDESEIPFPEYVERTVRQSHTYYERISEEQGHRV